MSASCGRWTTTAHAPAGSILLCSIFIFQGESTRHDLRGLPESSRQTGGRRRCQNGIGQTKGIRAAGDDAVDLVKVAEKCRSQSVFMTKADLITIIADKLKFPWPRAELLVDAVFDCLEQSIRRGEKIEIRGFGSFQVRSYRAYKGRNPRTGQVVAVRPKRLPHFKVSIELAGRINQRRGNKPMAVEPTACHGP